MAEKSKNNKRIHLSGDKYIIGDSQCYWIVTESKTRKDKDGNPIRTRESGYYTEIVPLMESYFRTKIRNTEINGEIADPVKVVEKTRKEIRGWFKSLDKAMEGEEK